MRWLVRLTGLVRRRFLRLPHWMRDAYGIISYVNFIELIPTLAAIAFAPRHFFRRLPLILQGTRPSYQTPVKFFVGFASLFLALFYLRHGELSGFASQSRAMLYMPALIPLTPIAMIGLTLACWFLYQLPRLAPNGDAFPPPNAGPFKMLLHPASYFRLDRSRFLWGLFYISVYFVASWQIVQHLAALNFLGVVYLVTEMGDGHEVVRVIVILLAIALFAVSIHGLVLYPYMEMFRASLRRPTKAVFEADIDSIRTAVHEYLKGSADGQAGDEEAVALHALLDSEIPLLRQTVIQEDHDYDITETEAALRHDVYCNAVQMDTLRDRLQAVSVELREQLETLYTQLDEIVGTTRPKLADVPELHRPAA